MEVVITEAQLRERKACKAYLESPEWDSDLGALVYSDWEATVQRLLSSRKGAVYLDYLVVKRLVPMTVDEFIAAREATKSQRT